MKFFIKTSLRIWPLNMTVQNWKVRAALIDFCYQAYNEPHWENTCVLFYLSSNSSLCNCVRVQFYLAVCKWIMSFSYFVQLLLRFYVLLSHRELGFYKMEGGLCSFSLALWSLSSLQIFLRNYLAVWLTWKMKLIFFLLRERNESSKG